MASPFQPTLIRRNLFALIAVMLSIPTCIIFYSAVAERNFQINEAIDNSSRYASQISQNLLQLVKSSELILTTLSRLEIVQKRDESAVNNLLLKMVDQYPQFSSFYIVDKSGFRWASTNPINNPVSYNNRKYFIDAMSSGRFSSGEYAIGKVKGRPVFSFALPMKDHTGAIIGAGVASIELNSLKTLAEGGLHGDQVSIVILDHKGSTLFNSTNSELIGKQEHEAIFRRMVEGPSEGKLEIDKGSSDSKIASYRKLQLPDEAVPYMYVLTSLPKNTIMEGPNNRLIVNIFILVAGTAIALVLAFRISERILLSKVSENERDFQYFIEHSNNLIYTLSSDGLITYASPTAETLLGYFPSELIGKSFDPFVHPDDLPELRRLLQEVLDTRMELSGIEYRIRHKDGNWLWYMSRASVMTDSISGQSMLFGIGININQRKLSEEALRKSEEKFRLLYESAGDSISVTTLQGEVLTVNPMACKMLGYTYEELMTLSLDKVDTKPELLPELIGIVVNRGYNFFDTEHFRKNSSTIQVSVDSRLITWDGQLAILNNVRDISERKKAEEEKIQLERQLLHAQKLESLGIMAGGIAHDFNNLLQSILGNMELASIKLDPDSLPRKLISQAMVSGRQATHLTSLMLAYAGKGFIDQKALDLNELVRDNTDILISAASTAVSIETSLSAGLPAIIADEARIQQLVMNLITNAAEAIEKPPGFVRIATGVLNCDRDYLAASLLEKEPDPGLYAFLEVSDNGCGMSRETISRLFDPFFTTKFTGRGLGMSAVMGIIQMYSGALLVQSELGKGTTFRVLFPVSESPLPIALQEPVASPQVEQTVTEEPLSGLVLVVDDEKSVLNTCSKMVKLCGFRVITAINGIDAIAKFREQAEEINLVLMDLTMPNMDGISAMTEIYSIRPDTNVLLASGFNKEELSERITGQPPSGFIRKPYSMNELETELRRIMQKTA